MKINKKVLFIFGCQRSGTTATLNYFKSRKDIKAFDEHGDIIHFENHNYDGKYVLRLCEINKLINIIDKQKEDKIVIKPLVESQHAKHILESVPDSTSIWMYRNPKDVAASMISKWGKRAGDDFIHAILNNSEQNWRNEQVDNQTRELVKYINNQIKNLTPADKSGIFWYVRNQFFFSQTLHKNPKIVRIKYKHLVERKKYLYNRLNSIDFNIEEMDMSIYNRNSINKGRHIKLNPIIHQLCFDLLKRLDNT